MTEFKIGDVVTLYEFAADVYPEFIGQEMVVIYVGKFGLNVTTADGIGITATKNCFKLICKVQVTS